MHFRAESRRPGKSHIRIYILRIVRRDRIISLLWRDGKTPDIAPPRAVRMQVVNLVDPPVVGCSRYKTVRKGISGKTDNIIRRILVTPERISGPGVHIPIIIVEVNIV